MLTLSTEILLNREIGRCAVVVGDGQMLQTEVLSLLRKGEGLQASITALGVAVKVQTTRAALDRDLVEDFTQGMGAISHGLRHSWRLLGVTVSSVHKTELKRP